jgi:hypothetical protein
MIFYSIIIKKNFISVLRIRDTVSKIYINRFSPMILDQASPLIQVYDFMDLSLPLLRGKQIHIF